LDSDIVKRGDLYRGALHRFLLQALGIMALAIGLPSPGHAQVTPGNALRFNADSYVSIPHSAAYNLYPFTVSAWVRTTNINASPEGIVSKYFSSGFNGWSMHTHSGRLRAWFFRNNINYVWNPSGDGQGVDGGFIADGRWHHVAFAVDPAGGRLFVDGILKQNMAWTGAPGLPNTTAPLHFGAIANFPIFYRGDVEEVSLWNYALTNDSINHIKYRRLNGNEDGLVSYWRLDEGAGSTVAETTPASRTGTLIGPAQWTSSTAPIALSPVAGSAGRFDGASADVSVPHDAALNSLPITFMAWVRTSQAVGDWPGIISKYAGNSLNGWALALSQGRLYPWYYRDGANFVDPAPFANAGDRFIADGQWHHIAFAVDDVSGRTFIDGRLVHTEPWVGTPTATTSPEAMHFGRYVSGAAFNGQIDRVSIWNTALSTADVQRYAHLPLTGVEAGLIAAYELDEASGATVTDLTALRNGTASGAFARVGSLARMGDGSVRTLANLDWPSLPRSWEIQGSPQFSGFPLGVPFTFRRFHDYGAAPPVATIEPTVGAELTDSTTASVPLDTPAQTNFTFTLVSENANAPATNSVVSFNPTLNIDPAVQLAAVSKTYAPVVGLGHSEDGGAFAIGDVWAFPLSRWLDFNGQLFFGTVETRCTSVAAAPTTGSLNGPGLMAVLAVNNNSGYLASKPTHRFGNGSALGVTLFDDGHAEMNTQNVNIIGPAPDRETIGGITFERSNMVLSPFTELRSAVVLLFPAGFSVTLNPSNRVTLNRWPFLNQPLDPATLLPAAPVLTIAQNLFGVQDTKPFWMEAPQLEWSVGTGELTLLSPVRLHYVRQQEDDLLSAARPILANPTAADRISNDGYWHNASSTTANAIITADTNGVALLALDADLPATRFRPHFPYVNATGDEFIESTGGTVWIRDNGIDLQASFMNIAGAVPVPYARDCADKSCSGLQTNGPQVMQFTANGDQLQFTRDGGLLAYGSVPAQNLTWGYIGGGNDYAHRTSDVQDGAFHMPGTFLLNGETRADPALRPAVLLHTGAGDAADPAYLERLGTASFYDGFANYAGLNFRSPGTGHSILALTPTGDYPLVPEAKYYARFGGISGIHQAETFPPNMTLYGYAFTFTRFALSFLDSETHKSLTDGAIHFPTQPAGFVQEFQEMKFLCRGGLNEAKVPPGLDPKHLNYWNTDFSPLTLQFKGKKGGTACNDADRKLVLGVETKLPFIPEALHAALGFHPNGNLLTYADDYEGCDSRFPVPAQLSMRGPGGSYYKISTASDGYFNNWDVPNRPAAGFYNLAGSMDVFFFEDVKVHLHVTPTGPETAEIAIMGGWRAKDKTGEDLGWKEGTDHFFNKPKFDVTHRGHPAGVTADAYRNSATAQFRPRAQKNWIEVAQFDYPLFWDKVLRQFSSFEDSTVFLPVINVNSRMKALTPGKADIDFNQDLELKLPRLKALDFVNDALNEVNGPLNSLSNTLFQALSDAAGAAGLTRGLRGLQHTLRDQMDDFFRPVLEQPVNTVVDRMYPLLAEQLRVNPGNFLNAVPGIVSGATVDLKGVMRQINGVAGNASSVVGKLNGTLADVDATIGVIERMLQRDPQGNRHVVRVLLQKIAQDQPVPGIVTTISDGIANQLLRDLEPTLAELENQLRDLRNQFNAARTALASASGDFNRALNSITAPTTAFDQYQQLAAKAVSNLLASSVGPAGDYFTANPEAARQQMRERLMAAFMASTVPAKYQQTFKQFLYDDDALLNTLLETLFQQVNQSIRNGLSSQLSSATDGLFQDMKGPGGMGKTLASAQIRGAPTFNGDALKKIRLDARMQMEFPDELQFNAYMQITELDSQSVPVGCIPAGAPAAEVRLGARDVPLNWIGIPALQPLTLTVEARWTLQSGSVIGIGGLVEINGEVGFKGCSVKQIGATLAIGEVENYFACKAAGTVLILGIPVNVHVGLFVGDACTLEPLVFIHPDAPRTLENAVSFAGVYLNFGGGLSLSEILFGTSSCFLDIEATIDTVLYYQGGTAFGRIGMRQAQKISADVICLISASVELVLFSRLTVTPSGTDLTLGGSGELCGKIGFCPFCIEGCVGITIMGTVGDGGIDYSVDL